MEAKAGGLPPLSVETKAGGLSPPVEVMGMRNVVRLALSSLVEGHSGLEYERDVTRMELCGTVMPMWRCRSRHFCRYVEHLAVRIIQSLDAADINRPLGALGIPSDFGILIDPVTIGSSKFARHDTVLMQCLSAVSPHTHRIHTPMFGGGSMAVGGGAHRGRIGLPHHGGVGQKHPVGLGFRALQARCSVIGGDGQIVAGGPDHRHKSSQAAEQNVADVAPRCTGGLLIVGCLPSR